MLTHLLAFICQICPLCVCARRWPQSRFARVLAGVERRCPACRAYKARRGGISPEQLYEHQDPV